MPRHKPTMSKNSKTIWFVSIGAIVLLVIVWVGRDLFLFKPRNLQCEDGPRKTIDIRDFITQYSAYSIELEAAVSDRNYRRNSIRCSFNSYLNLCNRLTSFANFWWRDTTPVR